MSVLQEQFLSELEIDRLKEILKGTPGQAVSALADALLVINSSMLPSRAEELLGYDGFGLCCLCGEWNDIDADYTCTSCH